MFEFRDPENTMFLLYTSLSTYYLTSSLLILNSHPAQTKSGHFCILLRTKNLIFKK